jgi:hypothetical protein
MDGHDGQDKDNPVHLHFPHRHPSHDTWQAKFSGAA